MVCLFEHVQRESQSRKDAAESQSVSQSSHQQKKKKTAYKKSDRGILCKIHIHRRRNDTIIPGIPPIAPVEGRSPLDVVDHAAEEPHPPPSSGRRCGGIAGAALLWRKLLLLLLLMMLLVAMQAIVMIIVAVTVIMIMMLLMLLLMIIIGPRGPQRREPRSLPTLPGRARWSSRGTRRRGRVKAGDGIERKVRVGRGLVRCAQVRHGWLSLCWAVWAKRALVGVTGTEKQTSKINQSMTKKNMRRPCSRTHCVRTAANIFVFKEL